MTHPEKQHQDRPILDLIDHTVVPDPDPVQPFIGGEEFRARWTRVVGECVDTRRDTLEHWFFLRFEVFRGARCEFNAVGHEVAPLPACCATTVMPNEATGRAPS